MNLEFEYDQAGNRTQVEDSFGGVTTSTYDAANQLVSRLFTQTGQPTLRVDQSYDDAGRVDSQTRYSDAGGTTVVATSEFVYDASGRLTELTHKNSGGSTLAGYDFVYDAAGQLTSQTDHGVTRNYTYDLQGQVTGDGVNSVSYDENGNRTNTGYVTGDGNQLESDGVWNFTYDAEGNQTKKVNISSGETWTYGYDHNNQMVWAEERTTDGGTLQQRVEFKYDAFGLRLEKKVDADGNGTFDSTQRYAYDGWKTGPTRSFVGLENFDVWADLDGSGSLTTRYLRGDAIDQVFARVDGSDPYWYLTDHLGSIRDITDDTGAVVKTVAYDAFGNILSQTGAGALGRYAWTGREVDVETGLQYNRARYYDPTIGRWISQDPLGFDAGDGNLYRYVRNGSTYSTDASGLQEFRDSTPRTVYKDDPKQAWMIKNNRSGRSGSVVGGFSATAQKIADGMLSKAALAASNQDALARPMKTMPSRLDMMVKGTGEVFDGAPRELGSGTSKQGETGNVVVILLLLDEAGPSKAVARDPLYQPAKSLPSTMGPHEERYGAPPLGVDEWPEDRIRREIELAESAAAIKREQNLHFLKNEHIGDYRYYNYDTKNFFLNFPLFGPLLSAEEAFKDGRTRAGLFHVGMFVLEVLPIAKAKSAIAAGQITMGPAGKVVSRGFRLAAPAGVGNGGSALIAGSQGGNGVRLIHLTDEAGRVGIGNSGQIIGNHGIFAVPAEVASESTLVRVLRTGIPPNRTANAIPIPDAATHLFQRPVPIGPFSAWKYLGGNYFTPPGAINTTTGAFTAGSSLIGPRLYIYGADGVIYTVLGGTLYATYK